MVNSVVSILLYAELLASALRQETLALNFARINDRLGKEASTFIIGLEHWLE
jgi:hypothetical protein